MLVTGYWLLVAGCWLLVAGCWLLVAGYWLALAGILFHSAFPDPFNLVIGKANRKGQAAVKKIEPVPGDCFNNKTRAALGFEKTVEIPVKSEEYYHNQNRWDQKPRYGQCPQQDENQYINGYNADAVGDF